MGRHCLEDACKTSCFIHCTLKSKHASMAAPADPGAPSSPVLGALGKNAYRATRSISSNWNLAPSVRARRRREASQVEAAYTFGPRYTRFRTPLWSSYFACLRRLDQWPAVFPGLQTSRWRLSPKPYEPLSCHILNPRNQSSWPWIWVNHSPPCFRKAAFHCQGLRAEA